MKCGGDNYICIYIITPSLSFRSLRSVSGGTSGIYLFFLFLFLDAGSKAGMTTPFHCHSGIVSEASNIRNLFLFLATALFHRAG